VKTTANTFDVIVVGCGYAGAISAIEAHRASASVCVLEKGPYPGGISICSSGGVRFTTDKKAAVTYLTATSGDTTPNDVLHALAGGMAELPTYIEQLARIDHCRVVIKPAPANYPFPGHDAFGFVYLEPPSGLDIAARYPHVKGSPAGVMLFKVLQDHLTKQRIPVRTDTPAARLQVKGGRVVGVVTAAGQTLHAQKGVILACGGFEANPELQRQFWPGGPALSAAYRHNTGDGIRMAQAVGADLWHMWHYHGCYGFNAPSAAYPYGIRIKRLPDWMPGRNTDRLPLMAWILLDQNGRRFMNEYEPYLHDTAARTLSVFDPVSARYPRNPAFLITDDIGRQMYPLGKPLYNDPEVAMEWSSDNRREIEAGILTAADTPAELAQRLGLPEAEVEQSMAEWNRACQSGRDNTFGRPPASMHPLLQPPFYGAPLIPVVSNTQGGPRRDAQQRVLDPYGHPIPGLYAVGECGSSFGFLYLSGGNIAECFVSGRIAGVEATRRD
jgi:succinate dehydrogenase/fumarate reductase flavoprotein subunit